MNEWEAILRLLAAAALGGAIGFEREFSDQPAGFRTHILVALGSALFTMVGAYGLDDFTQNPQVLFDPTRIAAQVVTGIGFLGAGAILQRGIRIRGLTTAAAMWVTAAIGMAAGFGYWVGAVGATAVSLIALFLLKVAIRRTGLRGEKGHLTLDADRGFDLGRLERVLATHGVVMLKVAMESTEEGHHVEISVASSERVSPDRLLVELSDLPDIERVDWRD